MRMLVLMFATFLSAQATAQVIDGSGVRANGVRIDGSGIHTQGQSVTRHGVRSVNRAGRGTTINGNDAKRRLNCQDGDLTINGNRNDITAVECSNITVTGNRNRLHWHRSRGRTAVSNVGTGNSVSRF